MFLIVRKSMFGNLKVLSKAKTPGGVIDWLKKTGNRKAFIVDADKIEKFVKKYEE